jgi:hypothetical protein
MNHLIITPKSDQYLVMMAISGKLSDELLGMNLEEETGTIKLISFSTGGQNIPEVSSGLASKFQSEKGKSAPLSETMNQ